MVHESRILSAYFLTFCADLDFAGLILNFLTFASAEAHFNQLQQEDPTPTFSRWVIVARVSCLTGLISISQGRSARPAARRWSPERIKQVEARPRAKLNRDWAGF